MSILAMAASLGVDGDAKLAPYQLQTRRPAFKGVSARWWIGRSVVTAAVDQAILDLLQEAESRSVSPEAVARRLAGDGWRGALPSVRAAAIGLARCGRLHILRHGRVVDPDGFKGVYRLGPAIGP